MKIDFISNDDLTRIGHLQPLGWSDIISEFNFYISSKFCYPIKVTENNKIVGIGCSIIFGNSGWLAHIIVDENFRGKGIGATIVQNLLDIIKSQGVKTNLLIATAMGLPLYQNFGFRIVTDYIFMQRTSAADQQQVSPNIIAYKDEFRNEILRMDKKVCGEDRSLLIEEQLVNSFIFSNNGKISGFYVPTLKEGPIIATDVESGIELMRFKYFNKGKAVLPSNNQAGINFLKIFGFEITNTVGVRMILGDDIEWIPENIFSRIGGNFG